MDALNRPAGGRRQRGAAAIEFSLIFILFFTLFYAIVAYSLAMLVMQGLTQAAEEGVRAAVAVDPLAFGDDAAYVGSVQTTARARVVNALSWLPKDAHDKVVKANQIAVDVSGAATGPRLVTVTVTYPEYATKGLVPTITLPLIGDVPRVPASLVGRASLQTN